MLLDGAVVAFGICSTWGAGGGGGGGRFGFGIGLNGGGGGGGGGGRFGFGIGLNIFAFDIRPNGVLGIRFNGVAFCTGRNWTPNGASE